MYITESESLRLEDTPGHFLFHPTLLKAGSATASYQGPCPVKFWVSLRMAPVTTPGIRH